MDRSANYERVLKKKTKLSKKILVFAGYALFAIAAFYLTLYTMNIYIGALAIIATATLIGTTLKYLKVEIEYMIVGGIFTVAHIYGNRKRRIICEFELSDCTMIAYATEENKARAMAASPSKVYKECASEDAKDVLVALWEESKDDRGVIVFEYDERTLASLYRSCPQACSLEIRVRAR